MKSSKSSLSQAGGHDLSSFGGLLFVRRGLQSWRPYPAAQGLDTRLKCT